MRSSAPPTEPELRGLAQHQTVPRKRPWRAAQRLVNASLCAATRHVYSTAPRPSRRPPRPRQFCRQREHQSCAVVAVGGGTWSIMLLRDMHGAAGLGIRRSRRGDRLPTPGTTARRPPGRRRAESEADVWPWRCQPSGRLTSAHCSGRIRVSRTGNPVPNRSWA